MDEPETAGRQSKSAGPSDHARTEGSPGIDRQLTQYGEVVQAPDEVNSWVGLGSPAGNARQRRARVTDFFIGLMGRRQRGGQTRPSPPTRTASSRSWSPTGSPTTPPTASSGSSALPG